MLRVLYFLCASLAALGCTDPGCIRNSECGPSYRCREARCVPANTPSNGRTSGGAGSTTTPGSSDGTGTLQEKPDAAGVEILDAAVATTDAQASP